MSDSETRAKPATTPKWETDEQLAEAARWRYQHDARFHAEAYMAAQITVPLGENESLTVALREVAIHAACVALLIHEGPDGNGRSGTPADGS
jgi:hypothetical protein